MLLNKLIGPQVAALLHALGVHPHDPANPIPEHVVMGMLVVVLGMAVTLWLKGRLSIERPGATQQVVEMLLTNPLGAGIRDLLDENAGHHGRQFVPVVGSITIFILLSNLLSVVPIFTSPTGNATVPLACAILTFLYFNWQGIKHHGPMGYLKHFCGPIWWLAPLIFPVEIISTTARVLSLTVRLWANMFSSELLYFIFLGLLMGPANAAMHKSPMLGVIVGILPATLPILFILLHVFVAVIQSFVFTILPSIYLGMATAEEH
ncbi:MAG: F0F1 ATP synthase subunit A [Acidobacteria bacterium]|nr:F0F1 ATP synthase subunit A [Acidobacteriota bacterium]